MRAFIFFMLLPFACFAQHGYGPAGFHGSLTADVNKDTVHFTLPANDSWGNQPWRDKVYRFSEFQVGKLEFSTGFIPDTRLRLNYNSFFETIDVLTENGEISPMKKLNEVRAIWIGDHKFLNDRQFGYLELVESGNVALGVKYFMFGVIENSNEQSAPIIGMDNRTATNRSTRHYWPSAQYFFVSNNLILRPSPQALPKLFPTISSELKDYIKVHQVDFRKRGDLLELVRYCNEKSASIPKRSEGARLDVPIHTGVQETIFRDSIFRLPEFSDEATLVFKDGKRVTPKYPINFNQKDGLLQWINSSGDTTSVGQREGPISYVVLDGITFLHNESLGWIEILIQGKVALAMRKRVVEQSLVSVDRKLIQIETQYYYLKGDKILPATARSLLAFFPRNRKQIEAYLSANTISFYDRADIAKVLGFASSLRE